WDRSIPIRRPPRSRISSSRRRRRGSTSPMARRSSPKRRRGRRDCPHTVRIEASAHPLLINGQVGRELTVATRLARSPESRFRLNLVEGADPATVSGHSMTYRYTHSQFGELAEGASAALGDRATAGSHQFFKIRVTTRPVVRAT